MVMIVEGSAAEYFAKFANPPLGCAILIFHLPRAGPRILG
jgi:hypothetical protein